MSLALLVLVLAGGAGAVWVAGIHLSNATDVLDHRLGIGEAVGGLDIFGGNIVGLVATAKN
jgi:cation:H+ antiporter